MKRKHAEQFNQEVDNYRKALLSCAKTYDWEAFKAKAGRLFDYVESVEFRELERRFFTIFNLVLTIVFLSIFGLLTMDFSMHQEMVRLKNVLFLSAVLASTFELFFYLDYRYYSAGKTLYYRKRRERFIKGMEQDFRSYVMKAQDTSSGS